MSQTSRILIPGLAIALTCLSSAVWGQGQFGTRTVGGTSGIQPTQGNGLQQSGTVTSSAAISRSDTGFVGSTGNSVQSIRGQATSANAGIGGGLGGGLGGFGGGLGGLGGGLGGFGGGLGGFGGGLGGFGGGLGGFNSGFGGFGGFGNQGFGRQGQGLNGQFGQGQATQMIPFRLSTTGLPQVTPAIVAARMTRFETRVTKLPRLGLRGPLRVSMEGTTAIVQGQVATDRDRDLVARLVLLEPGVEDVRNELSVVAASAPPELETVPPRR